MVAHTIRLYTEFSSLNRSNYTFKLLGTLVPFRCRRLNADTDTHQGPTVFYLRGLGVTQQFKAIQRGSSEVEHFSSSCESPQIPGENTTTIRTWQCPGKVHSHSQLQSKFKGSLGYMKPYFKKQNGCSTDLQSVAQPLVMSLFLTLYPLCLTFFDTLCSPGWPGAM